MDCPGDRADHCCQFNGQTCEYLEENTVTGRRWACGLFRSLGSFAAVHTDARYLADVRPRLTAANIIEDCGDWPPPGVRCATCGGVD